MPKYHLHGMGGRVVSNCCGEYDPCPRSCEDDPAPHIALLRETLRMRTGDPLDNEALALIGDWWSNYLVEWPEDRIGKYYIVRFAHPNGDWSNGDRWTGWFTDSQLSGRMIPPPPVGRNYTGLFELDENGDRYSLNLPGKAVLWMSDTPSEILDHMEVIHRAYGHVLITGLGLGALPKALLSNPCVERITIIEKTPEIIKLVGPKLSAFDHAGKLTIIEGDAYTYKFPEGSHFDIIWHDIWPTISEDNLPQMRKLLRRYKRYNPSWMGCWRMETCMQLQARYLAWKHAKDKGNHALARELALQALAAPFE